MYSRIIQKKLLVRQKLVIFLTFVVLTLITVYSIHLRNVYIEFHAAFNNISCHSVYEGDALPSAEDPDFSPKPNSIFFHDTSCLGELNSRQACAVESASRAHPNKEVYLLFSAPVSEAVYKGSCIATLQEFPNIKIARVHITEYAKDTPLEEMVAGKPFKESRWRVQHTSDILRYLSLYKWGGIYLDTDMIVVKSLTPLGPNWVGKEDDTLLNGAAIAMSMDEIGRKLANDLINEARTSYRPDLFTHNGPDAITRVLNRMCKSSYIAEWSADTCQGFEVYDAEYLYPVHYTNKKKYFRPGDLEGVKNAYTHHFWNKMTHDYIIEKDSPYDKLAQKYCPTIYEMFGEEFGT